MGREALLRGDATRAAPARQQELRQLSSELEGFHGEGLLLVRFLAAARATLALQVCTRDWLQVAVAEAGRDEAEQEQQRAAEPPEPGDNHHPSLSIQLGCQASFLSFLLLSPSTCQRACQPAILSAVSQRPPPPPKGLPIIRIRGNYL
jgi:hypothetical protein